MFERARHGLSDCPVRFSAGMMDFSAAFHYTSNVQIFNKNTMMAESPWVLRLLGAVLLLCLTALLTAGCRNDDRLDPAKPVPLTMWHVYGSLTDSPMNDLVKRFNRTVGREKGIVVNVTATFTTTSIRDPLAAAARELPGSGVLPDMFTAYPRDALAVGPEKLMDWRTRMSPEALADYVPSFIEEGMHEGRLLVFPIAKSTGALFVNAGIFEKFSAETGVKYEDLATWEGLFEAARIYYEWSGGKAFYKHDDWWHYTMLGAAAHGATLFRDGKLNFDEPHVQKIWKQLARSAVLGHVCLMEGYSTTAMMTGDTVCGVESTASILYYKDRMTLPDNTTMPLRLRIFPVPRYSGGGTPALQRGSGLAVRKGDPRKEEAAAVFAAWLTEAEVNIPFVVSTGYLPVKESAYKQFLERNDIPVPEGNARAEELYKAVGAVYASSEFFIPPYFKGYGELEKTFTAAQAEIFKRYRLACVDGQVPEHVEDAMFEELREAVNR